MNQRRIDPAETEYAAAMARRTLFIWSVAGLGILLIGIVDFLSGTELRLFPVYYAPISFIAWYRGRREALVVAALCALSWLVSNFLAGQRYSELWIWIANTLAQGGSFAIVGLLVVTLRDAVMREKRLRRTDQLTSLLNGLAFQEEGRRLLAGCRRRGRPVTIAYIDLDDFKTVNDRHGHQAGDAVLRSAAELLRASIRPADILARLGGDEFAVLLPDVYPQDAPATVSRLRSLLAAKLASDLGPITGTIGGVTFITAPDDVESMIREADSRMAVAKAMGKNRVHLAVLGPGGTEIKSRVSSDPESPPPPSGRAR